ncbi:MAG TPA: hypothetical protein VFO60_10310, partial [Candidatus Dormibacteraeota bacterium]|nr:hypothetical protein [Candidatus Dormibacteraeota bacterium]
MFALPRSAAAHARAVAAVAIAGAGALVATLLPVVADGLHTDTTPGAMVRGVPLTLRADATSVSVVVIVCGMALAL